MSFEVGERVTFRSLQWEVEDNSSDMLLTLYGRDRLNQGRRAKVILDLEDIRRTDVPALRWTVGDPRWSHLEWNALHNAFRLTLSHGRGNLASVEWGRLILEPYQLVPLQRIENLPFPRLLIADDTGLGKTAEAGLILSRLLQRRRADRVLILCRARPEPERWRDELKEKFGIDVDVINDGDDYAHFRRDIPSHLNVFGYLSRVAMSMYFAAPSKRSSQIVDDLARVRWDVVIIDEAHHLAESGDSSKRRGELGRVVAESAEALLLLTATPDSGKAESFASLLRLIDPYLVVDPDRLDAAIVRPLVVRRLKSRVVKSDGSHFLKRKIHPLNVPGTKAENWLDRGLRGYCRQLRERARELSREGERTRAMGASFLESFFRRRLASSAYACRESLQRRLEVLEDKVASSAPDEASEDRDNTPLLAPELQLPSGKSEIEVVRDLLERAKRIPEGSEAKVDALVKLVERILAEPAEKAIVFTEFVDTLEMLYRVFASRGWVEWPPDEEKSPADAGRGLFFLYHGGTPRKHREAIRRRFLEEPKARILLATDAASESINLQKGCNNLVHLETVWNPNRYEQRNGRIDRYGQTREPQIYLLLNEGSIDERVAAVGYRKLEGIAERVGSVSNVLPLASRLDFAEFLDRYDDDHFEQAKAAIENALDNEADKAEREAAQDGSGELVRGESFDAAELRQVEEALASSREFVPEFSDVQSFLEVFLRAEGGQIAPRPGEQDVATVVVPPSLRREVGRERIPRGTFRRDIAVREELLEEENRVEFLSPGHPLVRAALRRARGWVFQSGFASRVSYRRFAVNQAPGFIFSFAERFLDGRGEAIEERFEAIFTALDGSVSNDPEGDLRLFRQAGVGGNLTEQEAGVLKSRFAVAFERCREATVPEVQRRGAERAAELKQGQRRIVEEALIRLGRWQQAAEERLGRRAEASVPASPGVTQLDLGGERLKEIARLERERERKVRLFRQEQQKLKDDETRRREEIRALEEVRLDTIDPIGALAIVPEGIQ